MVGQVETHPSSFFAGRKYAQHRGSHWGGSLCVRYHRYLITWSHNLPDTFAFAHKDSIHTGSRPDAMSAKKVEGSGEPSVDVASSEKESSETNAETSSELSDFTYRREAFQNKNKNKVKRN